jgi:adenylyltransferase/sulfurtransferase
VQSLDALTGTWREVHVRRAADRIPVTELIDYDEFCGVGAHPDAAREIALAELADALAAGALLIDVREPYEHDLGHIPNDRLIPLAALVANPGLAGPGPVVAYCATGARSARAATVLGRLGVTAVSLRGGFTAWRLASAPA